MDALEVLREAHMEAKSAFQKIEQASPEERGPLWAKLRPELTAHEQYEESFVYGPVAEDARGRDQTLANWDERHHAQVEDAKRLIGEIGAMDPADPAWMDRISQFKATLERHIQEEEGEIWPRIQQVWDRSRREDAGKKVEAAKKTAGAASTVADAVGGATERIKRGAERLTGG